MADYESLLKHSRNRRPFKTVFFLKQVDSVHGMDNSAFVLLMPAPTISGQAVVFPFSPEHNPAWGVFGAGLIGPIEPGRSGMQATDGEHGEVRGTGGGGR